MKTENILTLSAFQYGQHRTDGPVLEADIEQERLSFFESLAPIKNMIQEFKDYPLGTKIKVTMEVIPKK